MTQAGSPLAVRCFFREFSDMRERYDSISKALVSARTPYTVGFTYIREGIAVRNVTYPVLKMGWVEGQLLDEYIHQHLGDGKALRDLAGNWKRFAIDFRARSIAHGDLQHGNVLCLDGAVRLVDYDGMFVPGLQGRQSHELGHPNYQHPERSAAHFGPYLDHFSQWVVYTSLLALAAEPELWTDLGAGDERLLFSRADFLQPTTSLAFTTLTTHSDASVKAAATQLRAALDIAPDKVPPLQEGYAPPAKRRLTSSARSRRSPIAGPAGALPDWVTGHVPQLRPLEQRDPGPAPRVGLAVAAAGLAVDMIPSASRTLGMAARIDIGLASCGVGAITMLGAYLSDGNVRSRVHMLAVQARTSLTLLWYASRLRTVQDRETAIEHERGQLIDRQVDRTSAASGPTRRRIEAVNQQVKEHLTLVGLALTDARMCRDGRMSGELKRYQDSITNTVLRQHKVRKAHIRGAGWHTKLVLLLGGIRSAADVDARHAHVLNQFSSSQAAAILEWREQLRPTTPKRLPEQAGRRATRRVDKEIAALERLREEALLSAAPVLAALKQWKQVTSLEVASSSSASAEALTLQLGAVHEDTARIQEVLDRTNADLDTIETKLEPFRHLTLMRFVCVLVIGRRARRLSPSRRVS
jgi:hypothetical protein